MESRLVLDVQKDLVNIALLEDGRLVELNKESREEGFTVGNIYLARVKKLLPGLNAAFIDVGYKREGFLHCLDLGPTFPTIAAYTKIALDNRRRPLMMNKISDAIMQYVKKYNAEKKYSMIISTQGANTVLIADPALNITDDLLKGLNEEYRAQQNTEKAKK